MTVNITENAATEIKRILANEPAEAGLRLGVIEEGCQGLSYKMELGSKEESDQELEVDGIRVFINRKSADYLSGITLDYKSGVLKKGFVFTNPNAKGTCGCGRSFNA